MYADDIQLYSTCLSTNLDQKTLRCESCITDIKKWMCLNKLKLNDDKTEVLLVGSRRNTMNIPSLCLKVDDTIVHHTKTVRNLGTVLDSDLGMEQQVCSLRKKLIFELKKISTIRPFITRTACQQLVSSLLFSKLDYCNALMFGASADKIKRLQTIQNNAARLILRKRRREEATPLLVQLHWLPVEARIKFKAATLVYKCLDNSAPEYLQGIIQLYQPSRTLRSSMDNLILQVPKSHLKAGDRRFAHFGPIIWNDLPLKLRRAESVATFKKNLKTYFFSMYF